MVQDPAENKTFLGKRIQKIMYSQMLVQSGVIKINPQTKEQHAPKVEVPRRRHKSDGYGKPKSPSFVRQLHYPVSSSPEHFFYFHLEVFYLLFLLDLLFKF